MQQSILLAKKYRYTTKPNPVVGALILDKNEVICQGAHEQYGGAHAEVNCLNQLIKLNITKNNNNMMVFMAVIILIQIRIIIFIIIVFVLSIIILFIILIIFHIILKIENIFINSIIFVNDIIRFIIF